MNQDLDVDGQCPRCLRPGTGGQVCTGPDAAGCEAIQPPLLIDGGAAP